MPETPATDPAGVPTEHHLRSIETLRTCGASLAALMLAATVTSPFLGDPEVDFSWLPVLGTIFWGLVVLGLGWERPRALAVAGTVLVALGVTALIMLSALDGTFEVDEEMLVVPQRVFGEVLPLVTVGALLLGGAAALAVGEVEKLQGRGAYAPRRLIGGVVAGVIAGALTVVLGGAPDLLESSGVLFTVCLVVIIGVGVTGAVAASPVALLFVIGGFVVVFGNNEWSENYYSPDIPELARLRLQLMIVVLAATLSAVPFRAETAHRTSP